MKLEMNGKIVLDITRAKAKQYEFGIDEAFHLELAQDPKKLLVFTIGILGELTALESRPNDDRYSYRDVLKAQLVHVGQYFEALSTAKLTPEVDEYLRILSSAAYYLADMPGSSLVMAKSLPLIPLAISENYLEGLLVWLLKSDITNQYYTIPNKAYNTEIRELVESYVSFLRQTQDVLAVKDATQHLRKKVYSTGSDRELLLVDTICALALRKLQNSSLVCLPLYTDMNLDMWRETLNNELFIKEFWPGQRLVGELGVLKGRSAVMQMPTSAGKTKSAELIIRSSFLSGRAKLAVVIAPFRALCREISSGFEKVFSTDSVSVNELRDVTNVDNDEHDFLKFLLGDVYKAGNEFTIIISTPEKLVYLLRYEPQLAEQIGLLIFDEGHQFDSGKRGVTYELLVASLKASVRADAQKVLISAVMANAHTIGDWLNGESGVNVQGSNTLPSIKSIAFFSWVTEMGQLSYLSEDNKRDSGLYVPRIVQQINLGKKGREKNDRLFPEKAKPSSISCYLGLRLCKQGPVALFCGDKRGLLSISKLLVDIYARGLGLAKPSEGCDELELSKIANLSDLHFSNAHPFSKAIKIGALPHSRGVPNGIRLAVEWAMENGKANLVICTSTLAQGVNLPIKYLIISSTMQGEKKISTRDFQNLIGRAGRSGYHTEGNIIFSNPKVYDERANRSGKMRWADTLKLVDFNNTEDCVSSLMEIIKPFNFPYQHIELGGFFQNPEGIRNFWAIWGSANNTDVAILLAEMDDKRQILITMESYFLSVLKDNPTLLDRDTFSGLAKETLAYHLANPSDRTSLLLVFDSIHDRIKIVPSEKYSYYGRTLLGLDQLIYIDRWIDANLFDLELSETPEELLEVCWTLITNFSTSKILRNIIPDQLSFNLAKQWISGESYFNILKQAKDSGGKCKAGSQLRSITQDHIVDHCEALAFDGMLIIGGMADIIEGRELSENLLSITRALQNRLKFGLAKEFDIWLYGKGYSDREVCKTISRAFAPIRLSENVIDYGILKDNKEFLAATLAALPSVYSNITN